MKIDQNPYLGVKRHRDARLYHFNKKKKSYIYLGIFKNAQTYSTAFSTYSYEHFSESCAAKK